MGLLDELEQQADEARRHRARQESGEQAREAAQRARLLPALSATREYFERFAARLRELDRVVTARYELAGLGTLDGLTQSGYAVVEESEAGPGAFRFQFRCEGGAPLRARVDAQPLAAKLERELRDAGLRARQAGAGSRAVVLEVEPRVPVTLRVSMDTGRGVLELASRNLFGIGVQTHRFAPERVDTALLDAIGHCVLREPSRFAEMTGTTVSEPVRRRLARDAARHRRRREAELGGPLRRAWFHLSEAFRRLFLRQ